jgi:hypothetical protein
MYETPPYSLPASGAPATTRHLALLGLALVGALVAGSLVVIRPVAAHGVPAQVYGVAAVQTLLDRAPARWLGQELVVRGLVAPCPWWGAAARIEHCAGRPLVLIGAPGEAPAAPLPLVRPAPQPLLSLAWSLPILGALLPRPPVPLVVAPVPLQVLRVRLLALPRDSCGGHRPCYAALLAAVGGTQ